MIARPTRGRGTRGRQRVLRPFWKAGLPMEERPDGLSCQITRPLNGPVIFFQEDVLFTFCVKGNSIKSSAINAVALLVPGQIRQSLRVTALLTCIITCQSIRTTSPNGLSPASNILPKSSCFASRSTCPWSASGYPWGVERLSALSITRT